MIVTGRALVWRNAAKFGTPAGPHKDQMRAFVALRQLSKHLRELKRAARDAARAGFDMILHATHMDEEAFEAVCERKVPVVPTFAFQANLADYGDAVDADPHLQEMFRREIIDSAAMLRRLHAAGVPLLCGTESGFSLTPLGEWHYRELEVFVRDLGFTPLQAIRAATFDAARALRMEGQVGEIAAGRLADLIVLQGDPCKDITLLGNRAALTHVMADGQFVDLRRPERPRRNIPGWRVSLYSSDILTRERAQRTRRS